MVCRATGLASGSAAFASNPWWDRWSLPGGLVPRSGGCSRPRLAGTIAGSRVSGGLQRWLLFGRALPPPPATRAWEPRSCPPGDGFTGCLFASGFYFGGGRLLARPRARTGRIPAGETRPQVLAPSSADSPGAARSGCWVLESMNKLTLFPGSLSKTFHILRVFHSVFLPSWQGSASPW